MSTVTPPTSDWLPTKVQTAEGAKDGLRRKLADGSAVVLVPSAPADGKDIPAYVDLSHFPPEGGMPLRHRVCLDMDRALKLSNGWAEEALLSQKLAEVTGSEVHSILAGIRTAVNSVNILLDELDTVEPERVSWLPRVSFCRGEYIRAGAYPYFSGEIRSKKDLKKAAAPAWPSDDQLARMAAAIEHLNETLQSWYDRFQGQAMATGLQLFASPNIDEKMRLGYQVSLVLISSRE